MSLYGLQKWVMWWGSSYLLPLCGDYGSATGEKRGGQRIVSALPICSQELLPRGLDIKQEELGDLVDKEMAATSAAIETATARIEVWKCPKI